MTSSTLPDAHSIPRAPPAVTALTPFIPRLIAADYARSPSALDPGASRRFPAAVLFADISGFTALSEHLASRGSEGAEELSRILNETFDEIVELIDRGGGDTIKFAGDALLAVWPCTGEEQLVRSVRAAASVSLAVRDAVHQRRVGDGIELSIKVAMSAGDVVACHVGNRSRRELVVAGPPLEEMAFAEGRAQRGEVVLGPSCLMVAGEHFRGAPMERGCLRLESVPDPLGVEVEERPPLPPESEPVLRSYVPGAVLARTDAGHGQYLGELRTVSAMFVHIGGIDYTDSGAVALLQRATEEVQRSIDRLEGSVNKLLVDDKGTTLLACFGLPPRAHEDDPRRALLAAMRCARGLLELGLNPSVGVTTGRVFAGPVGGERRREYTVLGDVVNTGARLMSAAAAADHLALPILCDESTATTSALETRRLEPLSLKGKAQPVPVFTPLPEADARRPVRQRGSAEVRLVGRESERGALERALDRLQAGRGGLCVVEGDAGIGKTSLLRHTARAAADRGIRMVIGRSDALEQNTPYVPWAGVFDDLLDLPESIEARRAAARAAIEAGEVESRFAALLNPLLSVDLPESDTSRALVGRARFESTARVVADVLLAAVRDQPTLILLEDGHWFDSTSWQLLERLRGGAPSLGVLLSTRPLDEPPASWSRLLSSPGTLHIALGALGARESDDLVCRRLGVGYVPDVVRQFVFERAQGNPFFTEEVTYALRDAGLVVVRDGEVHLRGGEAGLRDAALPTTVEGVVTQRIDRLGQAAQLVLKTASVIGRRFLDQAVTELYPVDDDRSEVGVHLRHADDAGLTAADPEEEQPQHLFRHAITRDVTYNLMLFAQRQDLHRAAGEWYERQFADDLTPHFPLLAHHFSRAGDVDKALTYLEGSGQWALLNDANVEARRLLQEAVDLDPEVLGEPPERRLRRGTRLRMMGEAEMGMGNVGAAPEMFKQALGYLGLSAATPTRFQVRTYFARQIWQMVIGEVFPPKPAVGIERDFAAECGRVGFRMAQCYYYANYMMSAITAAVSAFNFSRRAQESGMVLKATAAMSIAAGLVPIHPMARYFARRARKLSAETEDQASIAYVNFSTSIYTCGCGLWEESEAALSRAIEIYTGIDERKDRLKSMNNLAMLHLHRGQHTAADDMFREMEHVARKVGDRQQEAWGQVGRALSLFRRGHTSSSVELVELALETLKQTHDRSVELLCRGILATSRLLQGDLAESELEADRGLRLITELDNPTVWTTVAGYASVAFVFWERVAQGRKLEPAAERALRGAERAARVFPIGEPALHLVRASRSEAQRKIEPAIRHIEKAIRSAARLDLPWEQAFANLRAAVILGQDARTPAYLAEARRLFEAQGADGMVTRIDRGLGS